MFKKYVLGLAILATGLLVWSCGDGAVDTLNDNELIMINRFPSTIDYDMLDSIVMLCHSDRNCWEKAEKTGEIYKGDYTKVLRDSSGNIVVVEGDSAYIWKDGKKLPVFDIPTNNSGDEDDDESSSSTATSSSSSKSSASGYEKDIGSDGGNDPNGSGSGSGTGSVTHDRSSSSGNTTSSSSIDASQYTNPSSSSVGTISSSSIVHQRSSSSLIDIPESSVSQSSSSQKVVQASSSSVTQHGGNGGGNTGTVCTTEELKGTCTTTPLFAVRGAPVRYEFVPAEDNQCEATDDIEWNVLPGVDGSIGGANPTTQSGRYTFDVTYSELGTFKSVMFSMGGVNVNCEQPVTVERGCDANTYTCTGQMTGATNNLWKNAVQYTWNFAYSGCLNVTNPITWNGTGLTVNGNTATKTYAKGTSKPNPASETVTVTVVDELGPNTVECKPYINVVYEPDLPPTCAVANKTVAVGSSVAVKPTSVTGCAYDNSKCSYSLTLKDDAGVIVSGSSYNGGALTGFTGSSDEETLTYTLTLKNYLADGYGSCDFNVKYMEPIQVPLTHNSGSATLEANNIYEIVYSGVSYDAQLVCSGTATVTCNGTKVTTLNGGQASVGHKSECGLVETSNTISCQYMW